VTLTIDGRETQAKVGETLLQVARRMGAAIPTLCYHPAVSPYGACRLCLVEVKVRGRTRLVTSCCYPIREGLEAFTQSDRVLKARRGVMRLLLARAPESPELRKLAESMGITDPQLPSVTKGKRDCILCGLCVSVCNEVMGAAAISFSYRGVERVVTAPFEQSSPACLACGACAAVCPVGSVVLEYDGETVTVEPFGNRRPALRCRECGALIGGKGMGERVAQQLSGRLTQAVDLCAECKRKISAQAICQAGTAVVAWPALPEGVTER